jgi:hypothetical protein
MTTEDRAELTQLEEAMWREATRYDLAFQERRFAQDFIEFGRSGRVYSRKQAICTDSQRIQALLPLPNLSIRLLDTNTAQVTYDSHVTHDGTVEYAHRSSIWSRIDGIWVMRLSPHDPRTMPRKDFVSRVLALAALVTGVAQATPLVSPAAGSDAVLAMPLLKGKCSSTLTKSSL